MKLVDVFTILYKEKIKNQQADSARNHTTENNDEWHLGLHQK